MAKGPNIKDAFCITHIVTGLGVGGAERALHTLLTGGLQSHFDNRVISLTNLGHYGPLLEAEGIPVCCLGMTPGRPSLRALWHLRQRIRQDQPHLIQGWMYHGNIVASAGRRLASNGTKLAWNIRLSREGTRNMKRSTSTAVYAGARLSSGPEGIIYNSTRSRQQHEADGYTARCGIVIPNGFDTNKWRPNHIAAARLRHHLGLKDSVKIVGYVARAHTQKDLPNLFEAFSRVAEHDEDSHLVCIGRGLAEAAPQKLPSGRVSFMGERHDLADIMPGFTFLCLSSEVEGFPNVIGEAMACAVPCISTDVGDAAAIVAETGFVVPPRNANALAEALLRGLTMSEAERTTAGQAARQRIISHYSLPSVIEQYRNFYVTLLGIQ